MRALFSSFDSPAPQAAAAGAKPPLWGPACVEGCDAGADACDAPHATTFRATSKRTIRFIAAPPRTRLGEHASTSTASTRLLCHRSDLRDVEPRINSSQISVKPLRRPPVKPSVHLS